MVQIFFILVLLVLIGFLLVFIIKTFAAPKKIEGIQKYIKQGKYSAAIKLAKSMITKDPRDFKAHYYLGKAYLADNKPELALMEFKTVKKGKDKMSGGVPMAPLACLGPTTDTGTTVTFKPDNTIFKDCLFDRETIAKHLYTEDQPPLDFLIRTSGEQRLSNFMLWQAAYAEFYFTKCLWPDFSKKELFGDETKIC